MLGYVKTIKLTRVDGFRHSESVNQVTIKRGGLIQDIYDIIMVISFAGLHVKRDWETMYAGPPH